ncbi:pirin family protein [Robertkochia aurantiaca]|uniref:pirin family protein n=1 Tax=Robertkochia aurantiaca TaxID=2873700 RepID=UPI001CCBBFE8|nr:pirin family protein [Robertkochia sp. 3YJGBD-33]
MRAIKKIHQAEYRPIADLVTYSPLPTRNLSQVDPFIFLNHHGLQTYPPNNNGLPFGPHPHRGMETVTFIIEGDIAHLDSTGSKSVIGPGGVQWMTAGSGLIHAEVSSELFKKEGGELEILQLWLNLPASMKMTPPVYRGLQKEDLPEFETDKGAFIKPVSGTFGQHIGPFKALTNVSLAEVRIPAGKTFEYEAPSEHNIFCYVVRGKLTIQKEEVVKRHLVEFENQEGTIKMEAAEDALVLFGHAQPFNEPMVARGPFVMNTDEEITQAYRDFHEGKMGSWE